MIKQRRLPLAAISINHKVLPTPPSLATDKTGVASGPRHLLLSLSFSFHRCKGRGAHNRMKKSFRNHAWLDTIIYNLSNVLLNYCIIKPNDKKFENQPPCFYTSEPNLSHLNKTRKQAKGATFANVVYTIR
ncbi:hypothetical protein NC651_024822 [Populus alba x Populus x berolinensis]|nr:hypothetical protein NC651_024817 [Populus alba x Populus x berolinensis]KAJ6891438.1 hypothetical protein NC651_024822 [Populus alba x Populus x berolinensis]